MTSSARDLPRADILRIVAAARAHDLALAIAQAREGNRVFELALDLSCVRDRARDLEKVLGSILVRARDLNTDLVLDSIIDVLDRARDLACDLDTVRDRARRLESACDLDASCIRAAGLTDAISQIRDRELSRTDHVHPSGHCRPARLAEHLLVSATRPLPARERGRYREEFRAELAEIANCGGSRQAQVLYALRQMVSVWRLRTALRASQRRRAAL